MPEISEDFPFHQLSTQKINCDAKLRFVIHPHQADLRQKAINCMDMEAQALINYFNRILPLNAAESAAVEQAFKPRKVRRRQYILQEGDLCGHNTFVVEGCFRMYLVDDKGKEHNLQFAVEEWWIGDIGSSHSGEPSRLNIEALEHSSVLQIKKEDQIRLFVNYPKFNLIFRVFTENALMSAQQRILQNISSTAEDRYLDFARRYPGFFSRISNAQIASYLGVTPEFLSTIRKRIKES